VTNARSPSASLAIMAAAYSPHCHYRIHPNPPHRLPSLHPTFDRSPTRFFGRPPPCSAPAPSPPCPASRPSVRVASPLPRVRWGPGGAAPAWGSLEDRPAHHHPDPLPAGRLCSLFSAQAGSRPRRSAARGPGARTRGAPCRACPGWRGPAAPQELCQRVQRWHHPPGRAAEPVPLKVLPTARGGGDCAPPPPPCAGVAARPHGAAACPRIPPHESPVSCVHNDGRA
jgi:hypothetical protein